MGFVKMECPGCGQSIDLDESREFGFCSYCGTKVMLDKVIVEHKGSVKIDSSEELNNLYILARRAKAENDSEAAQRYYEQILIKDPTGWEPTFYVVYYRALNGSASDIQGSANRLISCQSTVINLIKGHLSATGQTYVAINEMCDRILTVSKTLYAAAKRKYLGVDKANRLIHKQEMLDGGCAARDILYRFAENIMASFGEEYATNVAVPCLKEAITMHNELILDMGVLDKVKNKKIVDAYVLKVKKYEPEYNPSIFKSFLKSHGLPL